MNKKGFTIAEILVTLVIIGVIAALAIPGLVNSSNNRQLEQAYKKAYADLDGATNQLMARRGTLVGLFTSANAMLNEYNTQLKFINTCPFNQSTGNCWHNNNLWTYLNRDKINDNYASVSARAILKNGMLAAFLIHNANCSDNRFIQNSQNIACAEINIDVNGFEKPNSIGRDIFLFRVTRTGLYPVGSREDFQYNQSNTTNPWNDSCNPSNANTTGWGCAGRIFTKGKMDY